MQVCAHPHGCPTWGELQEKFRGTRGVGGFGLPSASTCTLNLHEQPLCRQSNFRSFVSDLCLRATGLCLNQNRKAVLGAGFQKDW